jgi:hypothetical protein
VSKQRSADELAMHAACRDAQAKWWAAREERAAAAPPRPLQEPRPYPRWVPGKRPDVRVCHWGGYTYYALRIELEVEEGAQPDHEWAVGRYVNDRMRVWMRTPSLGFSLRLIAPRV